jgi:hypothetical protein
MDKKISFKQRAKARDVRIRDLARTNTEVRELVEERNALRTSVTELKAQVLELKAAK